MINKESILNNFDVLFSYDVNFHSDKVKYIFFVYENILLRVTWYYTSSNKAFICNKNLYHIPILIKLSGEIYGDIHINFKEYSILLNKCNKHYESEFFDKEIISKGIREYNLNEILDNV